LTNVARAVTTAQSEKQLHPLDAALDDSAI
jgi:hypothetical protein